MKKVLSVMLALSLLLGAMFASVACKPKEPEEAAGDIVILFTNDVHCGIDDNLGYAGLAAYKKSLEAKNRYVALVDCGDHMQGDYLGSVSHGASLVEIMNYVGYDYSTLGNHEFDFGLETLAENIAAADAEYLCCNFNYSGSDETLSGIKPYAIASFGPVKVGFVGVTTPLVIENSSPSKFEEDGTRVASFGKELGLAGFCAKLQQTVDACRADGADYIVVLSHLGNKEESGEFTSSTILAKTEGIDVLLDGHSHDEIECQIIKNKNGEEVLTCQTGTKLANIGQLIITPSGFLMLGYVSDYTEKDPETEAEIARIKSVFDEQMQKVAATLPFKLSISDDEGVRMIRSREMALGDLVADAYRIVSGADIGMINGGGVRADLKAGSVTYADIIAVNPFGNTLCVVEVTGQELADMLESFCVLVQPEYKNDGHAVGENGSFQQVSGLRFTVDPSVESSAAFDADGMFLSVGDTRRVSDIEVLENGVYVPLDPAKTYTVASTNYMIKQGGSSMGVFLKDHVLVLEDGESDYQVLLDYFDILGGDFSAYTEPDGRITVK